MEKKYINIPLGEGKTLSVHKRDAAKDSVIMSMLPKPPGTLFEASAGRAQLAQRLQCMGYVVSISNYDIEEELPLSQMKLDLNKQKEDVLHGAPFDGIICRKSLNMWSIASCATPLSKKSCG